MEQPSAARRSFWRFSLRELLLVMLAAGAMLGWSMVMYQKYAPFESTPFDDYFLNHLRDDIRAVGAEVDEPASNRGLSGSVHTASLKGTHRELCIEIPLAAARERVFYSALLARIADAAVEQGCTLGTFGDSLSDDGSMQGIHHHYHRGATIGVLNIRVRRKDGRLVDVVATLDEEKP